MTTSKLPSLIGMRILSMEARDMDTKLLSAPESNVPGLVAHIVTSLTLDSARSCVMQGTSFTQGKFSSIPTVFSWGGSISPDGFLPSILLLVVIIVVVVVVVAVIVVVVVVGEGVSPSRVFLLVLSAFAMVAAYASKAVATLSVTSFLMAA
ncbi:hypothetical protein Tco_0237783 [Tanacetum coccineum]